MKKLRLSAGCQRRKQIRWSSSNCLSLCLWQSLETANQMSGWWGWWGCSLWCCDFILLECIHPKHHWMSGSLGILMQAIILLWLLYSWMLMSWQQASAHIWLHSGFWVCPWGAHAGHAESSTAGFCLMLPPHISPFVCMEPALQSHCPILGLQRHSSLILDNSAFTPRQVTGFLSWWIGTSLNPYSRRWKLIKSS